MGGTVINTNTGRVYQNATVVECDGCPSDIGEVGYEYHAGQFIPCAPFGKGDGNLAVVCGEDCKSIKDSGIPAKGYVSEETAAKFGLGADAVPDDVLSMLSPVVRYWWGKRTPSVMIWAETKTRTSYNLQINNKSYAYTWEYSDSIDIDQDSGSMSLSNPTSVTIPSGQSESAVKEVFQKLKGKYCHSNDVASASTFYFPSDSDQHLSWGNNTLTVQTGYAYTVSSIRTTSPVGDFEFLSSADRNAYPDGEVVDGYEYVYLGLPWENARMPFKIVEGNYTGTGTVGNSAQVVVNCGFTPKVVFVFVKTEMATNYTNYFMVFINGYSYKGFSGYSSSIQAGISYANINYTENGFELYGEPVNNSAQQIMNNAGTEYGYYAFC